MKSLVPWVCLVATSGVQEVFANNGLEIYRQGNYAQAATELPSLQKDPEADYYLGRMRLYGYGQLKNNTLALRHFIQAGEKGFLTAQQIMARYALTEEKNLPQALYWFKKSAAKDDVQAQMYCAAAYLFGVGVKKNPDLARKYYIDAAKNGNSIAQITLAEYFLDSKHQDNKSLGLLWLDKALAQGNARAQLKMGMLYASGNGVERDLNKAKELMNFSIAQDYIPALYQMGELARQQNEFPAAKDWYLKAANKNYVPAEIALAKLYMQPGTPIFDTNQGFLWMLKAAQNNSSEAQLALAGLYQDGKVVEKNDQLAAEWKQKAAITSKQSEPEAQAVVKASQWLSRGIATTFAQSGYRLKGIFTSWENPDALKENNYNQAPQMDKLTRNELYKPNFVMKNPNEIAINEYYDALARSLGNFQPGEIAFPRYPLETQAADLQSKASTPVDPALPNSPEVLLLGSNYSQYPTPVSTDTGFDSLTLITPVEEGQQSTRTLGFMERLFNEAVLGIPEAQFKLGQLYEAGIGVNKDIQEAMHYYQLAAVQNDLQAAYNLGILYLEGKETTADYNQGIEWLRNAAFKGNAYAQYALARIGEYGYRDASGKEVIPPNYEQAIAMYYVSADNHYGPSQYRLAEILVREKPNDASMAAKEERNKLIKRLYKDAVAEGIEQAALPLAFFNAMDNDKEKQASAFAVAKQEGNQGNNQAALLLGLMYDRGIAVTADPTEALRWYQLASKDPVSSFILGTYLTQGQNISKDVEKGRALLKQSADGGFSYASLNLGILKQQQGGEFLPDLNNALTQGNSTAGLLLADYYLSLDSSEPNMQQARDIYQHFAEKGDKEGQLKLAFMLEQGLGGKANIAEAEQWYSKAAQQGQPIAQYLYGRLYQLGLNAPQPNYIEAKKWYASAQGKYAPAAVALGFIYDTVDDNYSQAQISYKLAADQQNTVGQFDLGLIYEKGKGRPVDFAKAQELYLQAAQNGHPQAMEQLAGLYFTGVLGSRDEQQAMEWYKKAAALGDRDALYQLGLLSETGVGMALDLSHAVQYYTDASAKGNAKATLALARMYQYGLGVAKDPSQAEHLYKEQAALNNPFAQYQLARFYLQAPSSPSSVVQAKRLLQQAQDNGSQQARLMLQRLNATTQQASLVEPVVLKSTTVTTGQSADLMYMNALNEWNRGNEEVSKLLLNRIISEFPQYKPAKHAYDQLSQQMTAKV